MIKLHNKTNLKNIFHTKSWGPQTIQTKSKKLYIPWFLMETYEKRDINQLL